MESFSRGWSFLKQAWSIAFKDKDLLKPSIYALFVGMIVAVVGIIPIIVVAIIFGDSGIGRVIMGILGGIVMFVQFMVTYIFSGMTIYLIYGYLTKGDGRMDEAWGVVRRDFFDIATLAVVSTLVGMARSAANNRRNNNLIGSIIRGMLRTFEALWTEASYLVLPAMILDDLSLKDGLQRILKITKDNFLLIGIGAVGVRFVTGLIGFVVGAIGFVIALAIAGGAVYLSAGNTVVSVVGIALAAIIFFTFVMVLSVFSSYTNTAYHTCLYMWARDVEKASTGATAPVRVAAPAPLAAVLGY